MKTLLILTTLALSGCVNPEPPKFWSHDARIRGLILEGKLRSAMGLPRPGSWPTPPPPARYDVLSPTGPIYRTDPSESLRLQLRAPQKETRI